MTELNRLDRIPDLDRSPDEDARPAEPAVSPATYRKGDVLHPEWGERPPWFGYIGVAIAIAAMLIGLVLMVIAGGYAWRWIGS